MTSRRFTLRLLFVAIALTVAGMNTIAAQDFYNLLNPLLTKRCGECHSDGEKQGGFELNALGDDLTDATTFAKWERVYDRVVAGEMPPTDGEPLTKSESATFKSILHRSLDGAHVSAKGTVLRRLNRIEYQNTMNDLFGVELDVQLDLPEDGRYHEFDNVGSSLGLSSVHLKRYMAVANRFLDESIVKTLGPPESRSVTADYRKHKKLGRTFRQLDDGAVARFSGGYLLDGQLQKAGARVRGWYRITVDAYAYQSDVPLTFAVLAKTYASGGHTEVLGYLSVPPKKDAKPVGFDAFLEKGYFLVIDPHGIFDPDQYKRKTIDGYTGPGLAVNHAKLEGPINLEFPSLGHRLVFDGIQRDEILPARPAERQRSWYKPRFRVTSDNEVRDAQQSLIRVASAAFRQPATSEDVARYVSLFQKERGEGASFEDSLHTAVVAILCSPRFLYLPEASAQLDDHDLAVRLSLLLTRSKVDDELKKVASSGRLNSDAELRRQTERLFSDVRFERFIKDFCDAWLDLRDLEATFPDRRLFPEFDEYLRYSLPLETRSYVRELIQSNRSITNLVDSDFAMLNERLAGHYDLPAVDGPRVRKVKLPKNSLRGGLLSQASVLRVTANGTNTSPVTRGVWVIERILGETPQPPPPGTPGVEPDTRGATTLRELLEKHRSTASCNSCHQDIDPPGFALECFNPTGQHRERFRLSANGERVKATFNNQPVRYQLGAPVDSSGILADGRAFDGFRQFREYLANEPDTLAKAFVGKLLTFATGREMGFSDRAEIARIVRTSAETNYRIRDLFHLCIQSDIFRNQ